jgi:hypothetical protein
MPINASNEPRSIVQRASPATLENWNARLFSRATVDFAVSDPLVLSLAQAHRDFGLGLYQPKTTGASNEIIPVWIDQPLQPQRMRQAGRIEFQLLPSHSERKRYGAWRGDWKPTLPPDLDQAERMVDRVELARQTSHRSDVQVGAAIAAANIAEDLHFLIDCGFDYACVIIDGCYDLFPGHRITLSPIQRAIDAAMIAREQAKRSGFGIRIAAYASPQQAADWLRSGIDAIAIDAWIQDRAPASEAKVESFGGILIDTARSGGGNTAWISSSIRDFILELQSEQSFFAG